MRRLLLTFAVLPLLVAACGDDDAPSEGATTSEAERQEVAPSTETQDAQPAVVAASFTFEPATVEVSPGDAVTWRNEDGVDHTVTAGVPDDPAGTFDEVLSAGGTVEVTFDEPGSHPYFCAIHPTMLGEVLVR